MLLECRFETQDENTYQRTPAVSCRTHYVMNVSSGKVCSFRNIDPGVFVIVLRPCKQMRSCFRLGNDSL
jgi:hypothetical protein